MAISVSNNGLQYTNLLLINGEISSMRYGGNYKSYGPQYVRGIEEKQGAPGDGNLWVTYSMNKEDIWISKVPVPVTSLAQAHANDVFNNLPEGLELNSWNIYSPLLAQVKIGKDATGRKALTLSDADPFDYAKAERVIPPSKQLTVEFVLTPSQNDHGSLDIEFQDRKGAPAIRLTMDSTGNLYTKAGYRNRNLSKYAAGEKYVVVVSLNTASRLYTVTINGKSTGNNILFAPVESVERIMFRTGRVRRFPDADTPTDQMYDLPAAGESLKTAVYSIDSFKTNAQ